MLALLTVLVLHTPARPDTGQACLDAGRDQLRVMACIQAARDTAARHLDTVIARILHALPDTQRAAFDSASEAWDQYMNAECDLPMRRATRDAVDDGQLRLRTVMGCDARLMDNRTHLLDQEYRELLLHPSSTHPCLDYEPDTVSLTGTLERHTYAGAPNFESIVRGDAAETGWYLRLVSPVCATGNHSELNRPMAGVLVVQIAPSESESQQFLRERGQRITVRGTLFEPGTLHWHARLGLQTLASAARP